MRMHCCMYGRKVSVEDVMATLRLDQRLLPVIRLAGSRCREANRWFRRPLQPPYCASARQRVIHTALGYQRVYPLDRPGGRRCLTPTWCSTISNTSILKRTGGYTGVDNSLILENLQRIARQQVPLEIRIPIVPTVNDGANLEATGAFLQRLQGRAVVRLLPYHNLAGGKYLHLGRENKMPVVDPPTP